MSTAEELAEKRAYMRRYYSEQPQRRGAWARANPDKRKEQKRRYYLRHRDRILAEQREYRVRYRSARREHHLELKRRHYRRHADQWMQYVWNRIARIRGNGGTHTHQEWVEKCGLFAWCCAYCGEAKPLERDHKVPISRGGTNDITNIVPACLPCNRRKGARTTEEFLVMPRAA